MKNKNEILDLLIENELSDVEVLREEKDFLFVNFYLDFDNDILSAARAYASEECKEDEDSEIWLKDYYFQYLYDFANDEVLDVIEEISEELELSGEFMSFEMKNKEDKYVQFMIVLSEEDSEVELEKIVSEYINSLN